MFDVKDLNDDFFATVDPEEVLQIKKLDAEAKTKCFQYFLTSDLEYLGHLEYLSLDRWCIEH